ncbi:MAG: caspase family protein [bacterium]
MKSSMNVLIVCVLCVCFLSSAHAQIVTGESNTGSLRFSGKKPIDTTPPTIELLEPIETVQRGLKIVRDEGVVIKTKNNPVRIKGIAFDSSGIASLTINEKDVLLRKTMSGFEFVDDVLLKSGVNEIEVLATDQYKNFNRIVLKVQRETLADLRLGDNYALMFASDRYNEWPPLINPINDARTIKKELSDSYGFECPLIENPTLDTVFSTLREYTKKQFGPNDQLLIFIAGHGHFDEDFKEGFIVTSDSKSNDLSRKTYISHERLRSIIDAIPCQHILLIMDVCFGGTFDRSIAMGISKGGDNEYSDISDPEFILRKMKYKTRIYLTSGGKSYVPDGRPGQHSPFARKFLDALRGFGGRDKILTLKEILVYLERVNPEPRYGEFGGNEPGSDFLLIAR